MVFYGCPTVLRSTQTLTACIEDLNLRYSLELHLLMLPQTLTCEAAGRLGFAQGFWKAARLTHRPGPVS